MVLVLIVFFLAIANASPNVTSPNVTFSNSTSATSNSTDNLGVSILKFIGGILFGIYCLGVATTVVYGGCCVKNSACGGNMATSCTKILCLFGLCLLSWIGFYMIKNGCFDFEVKTETRHELQRVEIPRYNFMT